MDIQIGSHCLGKDHPTYFIADISANHDGDLERAKLLIRLAKESGADAAKFQNFRAPEIVSDFGFKGMGTQVTHQATWEKSVFEVYQDASIPFEWTPILKDECDREGIDYFSSPYDFEAIDMLDPYVPAYKIGSGDITWLEALERMAEKNITNILNAIEKSKGTPLPRLVFALGIRHVGEEMAEILAKEFGSIDGLANTSREELLSIPTVGPKIADSIIAFFGQEENKKIIRRLKNAGVNPKEERAKPEELPLAGQEFVITGRLETFSRQEAEARIKALGGTAKSDVTRETTYLVVGAEPGSKLAHAQALGTKQLTEEEFLKLLEQKS